MLAFLACSRRYGWRLQLDVRHYFASIHHGLLYELFARRLRDPDTLGLIRRLLEAGGQVYRTPLARRLLGPDGGLPPPGCGLPLGGYLSHWCGGLYLDGLDHFVKRELKIRGYQRYMDDMSLFGDQPAELEQARDAIADWLLGERRLALKRPDAPVVTTRQPASYLGFRISRSGLLPGPKAKCRLRRRLQEPWQLDTHQLARGLRAYRGVLLTIG